MTLLEYISKNPKVRQEFSAVRRILTVFSLFGMWSNAVLRVWYIREN